MTPIPSLEPNRSGMTETRVFPSRFFLFILVAFFSLLTAGSSLEAQEKRKLRHILVANEQVANKLLAAAEAGTDFKAMARRYSLDVGTKILGGDLDWVSPGQMEPQFSKAAFDIAEEGGFATCKTRYGWHVIQLLEIRGATPKPEEGKPAETDSDDASAEKPTETDDTARVPVPIDPLADRNEDLAWEVNFSDRTYSPGEEVKFTIRVTNKTDKDLQIIDPKLWPLGMIVRYQFGQMNMPINFPGEASEEKFKGETIAPGAVVQRSYTMADYLGSNPEWPIVRVIWRGDILFNRIAELGIDTAFIADADRVKSRWRYYRSTEANYNLLPPITQEQRWFLCLFSNGRVWIELDGDVSNELREWTVSKVRDGSWDKLNLEVKPEAGIFFGTVDKGKATGIPMQKVGASKGKAQTLSRGDFLAFPTKLSDGTMGYGKRFGIVLNGEHPSFRDSVKIGTMVLEEGEPLIRIVTRHNSKQPVQLTLALAWPESLLPERTAKSIAGEANKDERASTPQDSPSESSEGKPKVVLAPEGKKPKGITKPQIPEPVSNPVVKKPQPIKPQANKQQEKQPTSPLQPLPTVFMETDNGSFLIRLYEDDAPNTVAHFIHLVESGFYDGKTFHRLVKTGSNRGFIQGGSPDGTSAGVLDYTIKDEPSKNRRVIPFSLVMARHHTKPNSASSQFFIAFDHLAYLDGKYTVFGEIINGQKSAARLTEGSQIEKVTVRNKRNRDYTFEKFDQKQ